MSSFLQRSARGWPPRPPTKPPSPHPPAADLSWASWQAPRWRRRGAFLGVSAGFSRGGPTAFEFRARVARSSAHACGHRLPDSDATRPRRGPHRSALRRPQDALSGGIGQDPLFAQRRRRPRGRPDQHRRGLDRRRLASIGGSISSRGRNCGPSPRPARRSTARRARLPRSRLRSAWAGTPFWNGCRRRPSCSRAPACSAGSRSTSSAARACWPSKR